MSGHSSMRRDEALEIVLRCCGRERRAIYVSSAVVFPAPTKRPEIAERQSFHCARHGFGHHQEIVNPNEL